MVENQLMPSYVLIAELLNAFLKDLDHFFANPEYKNLANSNWALPLIYNQTISQPYIVALRTQIAKIEKLVLPFAKSSLSEVNYLNKNEALGENFIPKIRLHP